MAVRDALLALLTLGPAYGFQLHGELAARTGGRRSVNVGQTYATLERLTKQRLIEAAGTTADGLPLHRLTAAGAASADAWLDGADAAGADAWDETVERVLIARSLPDCDAEAVVAAERVRWQARRAAASDAVSVANTSSRLGDAGDADVAEAQLVRLAASADLARAIAALAWLDEAAGIERIAFPSRTARPKRGRRPGATAAVSEDQASASA